MRLKELSSALMVSFVSCILLNGCAAAALNNLVGKGSATSTGTVKRAPINSDHVHLYYGKPPAQYITVGRVSADTDRLSGLEYSQTSVVKELKKQAASIGANGVINIKNTVGEMTGDAVLVK